MELGFLSPLFERAGPWATVYFDTALATEDAAARQELNARSAADRLREEGADEDTCRAVYERLVSLPRGPHPPGYAVFATKGEVVMDTALGEAPSGPPPVAWQALPHTAPLLQYADLGPRCLVAYVDRTGADFELWGTTGVTSAGTVAGTAWPVHRTGRDDWSERHFQLAVENSWEQNAAATAEELRARRERSGAELVVVAGEARQRHAVCDRLPADLRDHVVQAEHGVRSTRNSEGGVEGTTAESRRLLAEEVARAREAYARRRTSEMLGSFQAARAPGEDGRLDAAEGVPALVEAAREHRIGSLLTRPDGPDLHREVWIGDLPDQVAARRSETQYLGATEPVAARADDALLRSAATTGADVIIVRDPAVPEETPQDVPAGGLGALLRWPYEGAPRGGGAGGGQHATR